MAKGLTLKTVKANSTVPPALNIFRGNTMPEVAKVVRTMDLPKGIVKTKPEPWLHTALCTVTSSTSTPSRGASHTVIGCICITYVWDTRKVIDVQKLGYADVMKLSDIDTPVKVYDNVKFRLWSIKSANDNRQPLDGITMSDIWSELKKYADEYLRVRDDVYDKNEKLTAKLEDEVEKELESIAMSADDIKKILLADTKSGWYDRYQKHADDDNYWQEQRQHLIRNMAENIVHHAIEPDYFGKRALMEFCSIGLAKQHFIIDPKQAEKLVDKYAKNNKKSSADFEKNIKF